MNIDKNILECLPFQVRQVVMKYDYANEIRLSENSRLCITIDNKNLITDYVVSKEDIESCTAKFCKNSVHTYFDSIKKGYIPYDNGYRIGVCGCAVTDNGVIKNISRITSLNIRIPSKNISVPQEFLKTLSSNKGILVYSPVNTGKTTFLKALIGHFSSPPNNKRLSVIDCKNELFASKKPTCPVDYFVGYPKYEAINMAVQNMSPDIIVCDEIGLCDDVSPLIECANCGINLICSAHASSIEQLISRKNVSQLIYANIFEGFVGIKNIRGERKYVYKTREELSL